MKYAGRCIRLSILLPVAAALFSAVSCEEIEPVDPVEDPVVSEVTTLDMLAEREMVVNAPPHDTVNGKDLVIDGASVWRDFMPVCPPDGQPMIALVKIRTSDYTPFPPEVIARKLFLISGQDVWVSGFSDETRPPQPDCQIEKVARDGPKWNTGISVDVVVEMVDSGSRKYYLKLSGVAVEATY